MQPIKLQRMKRTNCWSPTRKVWFQKNDDSKEIEDLWDKATKGTLSHKDIDDRIIAQERRDLKKRHDEGTY